MATSPPRGDGRPSCSLADLGPDGNWVKRDAKTGEFMGHKQDGKPFKGVGARSSAIIGGCRVSRLRPWRGAVPVVISGCASS